MEEFFKMHPTLTSIGVVLAFLAPAATWLYTEIRSRWRNRLKADFELLALCRQAESAGSSFSGLREAIEGNIAAKTSLFEERKRYKWIYAFLGLLTIVGATLCLEYQNSLGPIFGPGLFFLTTFLFLGAAVNFFAGEAK